MDFKERVKAMLDKSVEVSRDLFGKAGDAARDLGEKGVLRLEQRELEGRLKKELATLGSYVFTHFVEEEKASLTAKNQEISALLDEISRIRDEIAKRDEKLKEANPSKNSPEENIQE